MFLEFWKGASHPAIYKQVSDVGENLLCLVYVSTILVRQIFLHRMRDPILYRSVNNRRPQTLKCAVT